MNALLSNWHTNYLLFFNRMIGHYGQNAYCLKRDVKCLIKRLGFDYRDSPKIKAKIQELLDDIENLGV